MNPASGQRKPAGTRAGLTGVWARVLDWLRRPSDRERLPPEPSSEGSRYRDLFDHVPLALYLSAPDGTILDVNPAMVEMLGYPDRESLIRLNAFDLYADPDDRAALVEAMERDGMIQDYEVQLRRPDGTRVWVLDHARAVRDRRGRVLYYEGALEEITERKRAEEELRQANETLRALIEHSPLAIMSGDAEGRVTSWNAAAEEIFGWSADEILGRHLSLLVPEDAQDAAAEFRARLLRGERLDGLEFKRLRRDGTTIDVILSAGPLYDATGAVIGTIGLAADITERKQVEETRRRLAEILEASPDLVGMATRDGTLMYLNPAGRRMLGVPVEECGPYGPIWQYIPESDTERFREEAIPAALRRGTWSGELTLRGRDGRERPTSMVVVAHRTSGGDVEYLSAVARDLTEMKVLEKQLRDAQTMDAIGRLAGGIAHDFNNLLTAIIGHADLLLSQLDDEQARTDAAEIKEAGQRAAALTSHLLAFGRRLVTRPRTLDLNRTISSLRGRLEQMAGGTIELEIELDERLGAVKADPVQLEEVICSLAQNAVEAMPDGGRLTVRTSRAEVGPNEARKLGCAEAGPCAVLAVEDTGSGIDPETQTHIFEPFFSTKKEVKGVGLGLATVYGIVKQCGGGITVDSAPGRGTTVHVYLPETAEAAATATVAPERAARIAERRTVLLVEDEPAVRGVAARALRGLGLTVLEAEDGVEALELLDGHSGPLDLLLTDVVMPRLGGPELAELICRSRPSTRVIYMSGYTEDELARHRDAAGDVSFVQKPFTPSELASVVRRELERASRPSAPENA